MFATKKKRPPLPAVRRTAGQSLREEWDRRIADSLPVIIFGPMMVWFLCIVKWIEQGSRPTSLRFWILVAIGVSAAAVIAYLRLMPKARNLVRGEKGERKVADALEDLRSSGYQVFHDLCREGFNIDHVVVGPAGVFAIETKFRSGHGVINFRNGQGLFVNDQPWQGDRDPVAQARGNAAEVRKLIKESCAVNVMVTALVVFVGDWKVKEKWQTTDARVVSESQLLRYFEKQDQPELTRGEIKLIASHLERSAKC